MEEVKRIQNFLTSFAPLPVALDIYIRKILHISILKKRRIYLEGGEKYGF